MERELPPVVPVTVSTPEGGQPSGELLTSGPPPGTSAPRTVRALAVAAAAVLAAGVLLARDVPEQPPPVVARPAVPLPAASHDGITATASLGGARTDQPFGQRLTLTVVLEPYDGRGNRGARLLGDEVVLVDVRLRGFAVVLDDRRIPVPLGRFGRANVGRATTVPLEAVVSDCAIEPQARREVRLDLRTGQGPVEVLQAAVQPELVRALDGLVARACRRPRG